MGSDRPDTIVAWSVKHFDALTAREAHDLLKLRVDIFVVEQACAYHEIDGRDTTAWHVMGHTAAGGLVAYARILPPENDGLPHIGRVVVKKEHRGSGLAHELMRRSLAFLAGHFGSTDSELAAQAHLAKFYSAHGYVRTSEEYDWDGIPHIDMRLSAQG